jgi:hypothetical protein
MATFDAGRLARLTGSDQDAVLPALQGLSGDELEHEEFMRAVVSILQQGDITLRHLAAYRLGEAAGHGIDISQALPALEVAFADNRLPEHLAAYNTPWHTISAEATGAVALFHLKRNNEHELRSMLAQSGWPGAYALAVLQSATESEIEAYLPFLNALLSADEAAPGGPRLPSKQNLAAKALSKHYLRQHIWTKLGELISHPSEKVRKGVMRVLDDAAEDSQPLDPVLPALLAIFERTDAASVTARVDAANVLLWFVLREKKRPKTLVLRGVDILKIPEIQAKIKELRRLTRKMRGDR